LNDCVHDTALWADRLRTLADENDNIIGLWRKKMTVLDAIDGVSRAWSSANPVTLVRSWRKLLQDVEDDNLQGFPDEEISKSEILDMVCVMKNFENIDKDNVEEWLQSDACERGFQHMTDTDIVYAAKQKFGEEGGEDKSEIRTAVRSLNSSRI
jgi:hypothetical protein